MIPYGLLSQLSLIALSVVLTMTYIKPSFAEIGAVQDRISTYQQEIEKVSLVNQKLADMVAVVDSVSVDDHRRLLTYMPNSVDTLGVPRDIEAIAAEAGVVVRRISYEGPIPMMPDGQGNVDTSAPEAHSFIFDFEGSYDQIKQVMASFEQNHYPLEVTEMVVRKMEGGFLSVTAKIYTYDRSLPPIEVLPVIQ